MSTVAYSLQVSESAGAAEERFGVAYDCDIIICFLPGLIQHEKWRHGMEI